MTRILITGGPRTGKTTLADCLRATTQIGLLPEVTQLRLVRHTDDTIGKYTWSEGSLAVCAWLDEPGPWIIEGVAVSRALRKWRDAHPGEPPPVDHVIFLRESHGDLTANQRAMAKGVETVHREIEPWLEERGINTEYRGG